ncbi:MAG: class I SAM-dependent methyltransferase [Deltaproteobacteria bacterium]|nr:class I SAM-dependent methyltransferase [Deltaproteobacteria bacterium]
MGFKVAGGAQEDGIVVGNCFDKYGSRNPLVKWLMRGYDGALAELVAQASPRTIFEVGCGEGFWVLRWNQEGFTAKGCDFSQQVIELARANAAAAALPADTFQALSIYDLDASRAGYDLVVCCEVLEHLADPRAGLAALQQVTSDWLVVSVPREPLWRALNLARGKYLVAGGNTPGHVQHWSRRRFIGLLADYFQIVEVRSPLPWTMALCRPLT